MSDISIKYTLIKTKKYKTLQLIMYVLWLPLILPFGLLQIAGNYADRIGYWLLNARFIIMAKICLALGWEGVTINEED